jgi:hypothetical protein
MSTKEKGDIERDSKDSSYVFKVFCYCRSVFFACFRNFTNTQQVKDLSSEAGRKEMEISSWYPSLPFTLCDHSVSSILEQKKCR